MIVFMTLVCCAPAAAMALNAEVQQLGADQYRLTAELPSAVSPGEAQSVLAPIAQRVCAGKMPTWGHYSFATKQAVDGPAGAKSTTLFEQDLSCGDEGPGARPSTPAPRSRATEADRSAVEARTLEYLTLKDKGDFAAANALFVDDVAALIDGEDSKSARRAFNAAAGLPEARTIVSVTFYDDPANAPTVGRYAAVDYRARYPDRAFYCGYVMWLLQADGSYRMVRIEESMATDEEVGRLSGEGLSAMMQQPGCQQP